MSQTLANMADVVKEVWTADRLEKQFYDETPLLDRLERTNRYTIGNEAKVPLHVGRSGGYSVKSAAGGALNGADEQKLDKATYALSYNWFQVELETGALNQASTPQSIADSLDLEVQGGISDLRRQVMRQAVSNGDALIAQCTTSALGQPVVSLQTPANGGLGFDAIERGWLYRDLLVDIGTTASEAAIVDGVAIASVTESDTAPTITLASNLGSGLTTSHYVSIKDARSGTTSYEMNGLLNIAGSSTSILGGRNPATAGDEDWKPAEVDTTTTVLTLDLLRRLQRKTFQKTGNYATWMVTSAKQADAYDALLQNQVRFSADVGKDAGNVDGNKWKGIRPLVLPDVPNPHLYMLNEKDLLVVTGKYSKPTWKSDIMGVKTGLQSRQGYTSFVDEVFYALNLGARRRNGFAAATALRDS